MTEILKDVHPEDVTNKLAIFGKVSPEDKEALEEAVYWIESAAKNELNSDYWRVLYKTLQSLPDSISDICDNSIVLFMQSEILNNLTINDGEKVTKDTAEEIAEFAFDYYTNSIKHQDISEDHTQQECIRVAVDEYCKEHNITTYSI